MSYTIPAIFDAGVFRPLKPVELAEGTQVEVQVPTSSDERLPEEIAQQAGALAWPDFVERTYGSCADLDLKRHEQGEFEPREPIA
jgi:predicted DNA-binding antitoxin AbrB/MazE fold protein